MLASRILVFKKDPNQEEAELLVRAAATMDPIALSKYANAMGIMWSPKVATSWVADRAIKEPKEVSPQKEKIKMCDWFGKI